MELIIVLIAIVVLGLGAMVAAGAFGGMQPNPVRDHETMVLPASPLTGDDLRGLRFDVTARGYSMAEVDALLLQLAGEADGRNHDPIEDARPAAAQSKGGETIREELDDNVGPGESTTRNATGTGRATNSDNDPVEVRAARWRGKDDTDQTGNSFWAEGSDDDAESPRG